VKSARSQRESFFDVNARRERKKLTQEVSQSKLELVRILVSDEHEL